MTLLTTTRRPPGPPHFTLPRGRVAQLAGGKISVLGHDLRRQAVVAPEGTRAMGTLADGSLLVVGVRETCVLAAGRERPESYAKLSIGARLGWVWGDRDDPRRFWLKEATFLGENELPESAGDVVRPLGELDVPRDALPFSRGRMVQIGGGGIGIHGPTGVRRVELPRGIELVDLRAAGDGDTAWASDTGGALLRLDLAGAVATVAARVECGGTIAAIDAHGDEVAALVEAGEEGRWSVRLCDAQDGERWRADAPFPPGPAGEGQLAVALGRFDRIVAVGDGQRMALFDLDTARPLASR